MSISTSTTATDRVVLDGPGRSLFEQAQTAVSSSSSWNQGDLLYFNTASHILNVISASGNAATFVGIADNTVVSGKLAGPYDGLTQVDAAQSTPGFAGPKFGVVASMILKTSDAFNIGDKVYVSDGQTAQTVSSTDAGDHNHVGIFVGPAAVASASAGQQGNILIGARYPAGTGAALIF